MWHVLLFVNITIHIFSQLNYQVLHVPICAKCYISTWILGLNLLLLIMSVRIKANFTGACVISQNHMWHVLLFVNIMIHIFSQNYQVLHFYLDFWVELVCIDHECENKRQKSQI